MERRIFGIRLGVLGFEMRYTHDVIFEFGIYTSYCEYHFALFMYVGFDYRWVHDADRNTVCRFIQPETGPACKGTKQIKPYISTLARKYPLQPLGDKAVFSGHTYFILDMGTIHYIGLR